MIPKLPLKTFLPAFGDIIAEVKKTEAKFILREAERLGLCLEEAGELTNDSCFSINGETVTMEETLRSYEGTLEKIFPMHSKQVEETETFKTKLFDVTKMPELEENGINNLYSKNKIAKPKVFIPVFPGTNCEYDTMRAFERAGADVRTIVYNNLDEAGIQSESVDSFIKAIKESQIIMFPGGFSSGDEPDGSGKFIATAFRNEKDC